jgi:DNA-binding transcriptional MerR regulator
MLLDRRSKEYKLFQKINKRRLELISLKFDRGLSVEEDAELKDCEKRCNELLPPVSPEQWRALVALERRIQEMMVRNNKLKKKIKKLFDR